MGLAVSIVLGIIAQQTVILVFPPKLQPFAQTDTWLKLK